MASTPATQPQGLPTSDTTRSPDGRWQDAGAVPTRAANIRHVQDRSRKSRTRHQASDGYPLAAVRSWAPGWRGRPAPRGWAPAGYLPWAYESRLGSVEERGSGKESLGRRPGSAPAGNLIRFYPRFGLRSKFLILWFFFILERCVVPSLLGAICDFLVFLFFLSRQVVDFFFSV